MQSASDVTEIVCMVARTPRMHVLQIDYIQQSAFQHCVTGSFTI